MNILGIETSCDETAVAVYSSEHGIVAHALYSQVDMHQQYGGVVPELASRDHIRKLLPMIEQVLAQAADKHLSSEAGLQQRLGLKGKGYIDAIAYTAGPGLAGALLVGACIARALAYAWDVPAIPVHHLEGHLLAPLLEDNPPVFPFVALLVSGGHTQLLAAEKLGQYRLLGETLDDAAGEAFDKTAKLMGLPYPGGPALAKLALQGNAARFQFPRPMLDKPGLDFSFSGLKTAVRQAFQQSDRSEQTKADIARAFEDAVVETLSKKCLRALQATGMQRLVIAGGVGANQRLRQTLHAMASKHQFSVYFPRLQFCTDNGAMIAYAGYCRWQRGIIDNDLAIRTHARWDL